MFVEPVEDDVNDTATAEEVASTHQDTPESMDTEIRSEPLGQTSPTTSLPFNEPQSPIKLFHIDTQHFLDTQKVRGSDAIREIDQPCKPSLSIYSILAELVLLGTITGTIKGSADPLDVIHRMRNDVRERQFFPYILPTGVTLADMKERWNDYRFSPQMKLPKFNPAFWRPPNEDILKLRKLATDDAAELAAKKRKRPKWKVVHAMVKWFAAHEKSAKRNKRRELGPQARRAAAGDVNGPSDKDEKRSEQADAS
jgi:hypothetical protein